MSFFNLVKFGIPGNVHGLCFVEMFMDYALFHLLNYYVKRYLSCFKQHYSCTENEKKKFSFHQEGKDYVFITLKFPKN